MFFYNSVGVFKVRLLIYKCSKMYMKIAHIYIYTPCKVVLTEVWVTAILFGSPALFEVFCLIISAVVWMILSLISYSLRRPFQTYNFSGGKIPVFILFFWFLLLTLCGLEKRQNSQLDNFFSSC